MSHGHSKILRPNLWLVHTLNAQGFKRYLSTIKLHTGGGTNFILVQVIVYQEVAAHHASDHAPVQHGWVLAVTVIVLLVAVVVVGHGAR